MTPARSITRGRTGPVDPVAWPRHLPTLHGPTVTLRQLRPGDAGSLFEHLNGPKVSRYVAPPPATLDAVERFIRWSHRVRRQQRYLVFGMVPAGARTPTGIIQLWKIESDFSVAEWGFVLGEAYWGRGLVRESARLLLDLAFNGLGVHRLEARVAAGNRRGHAVLRSIGATREARLREGFRHGETFEDYILWSLLAGDWNVQTCGAAGHDGFPSGGSLADTTRRHVASIRACPPTSLAVRAAASVPPRRARREPQRPPRPGRTS